MMCQPSRCYPKGVDTKRCASKDAGPEGGGFGGGPTSIGERNEYQVCWAPRGWIVDRPPITQVSNLIKNPQKPTGFR